MVVLHFSLHQSLTKIEGRHYRTEKNKNLDSDSDSEMSAQDERKIG